MESSTEQTMKKGASAEPAQLMETWAEVCQVLPQDLDASARQYGAIQRRRGVASAEALLHLAMGYAVLDKPLKGLGLWAVEQGIVDLAAPSLYERLCGMQAWLGRLLLQMLEAGRVQLPSGRNAQIELRDATVISRPGSRGTDWRIHLKLDLGQLCISGAELTDAHGGEGLTRFPAEAERIVVADRIHATANGLRSLLEQPAPFAIRAVWHNLPLLDAQQQPLAVVDWLKAAFAEPQVLRQEQPVSLAAHPHLGRLRLCALRLPPPQAERAIRRARQTAHKKGHTPAASTLFMAQFILVITNLPAQQWSLPQVFELYRFRWQVELYFKRLKSILFLDHLRARKPALAQTYLLAKLLAAMLLDRLAHRCRSLLPADFLSLRHPLQVWSFTAVLWEHFQQAIRGRLSLKRLLACLPRLQRFLTAAPRTRPSQLAAALFALHAAPPPLPFPLS